MMHLPSREGLDALSGMAAAVAPHAIFGIARPEDDGHVAVLYSFPLGLGSYRIPVGEVPAPLLPNPSGMQLVTFGDIDTADRVIEFQATMLGATQLVSWPVPDLEPATRFWIGLRESAPLTADQISGFEHVAIECGRMLREAEFPDERADRLRRLELAAGLLPTLFNVLDVREVFDRLSATAKLALPHDMLTLGLFDDDHATMTVYALSGTTAEAVGQQQQPYPPSVTKAWLFDIVDDRTSHPLEQSRAATKMGFRSSIRVQIRVGDRAKGGLGFMSSATARVTRPPTSRLRVGSGIS